MKDTYVADADKPKWGDSSITEAIEGVDEEKGSWGDYPLDDILIRRESRTIHDVFRRIKQERYVMDPDFQRDFIWPEEKQSKLIESVIMRIPLPVFYLAEDDDGRMIVVDGLQRLSTFKRFIEDELRLKLPERTEPNGKRYSELTPKLRNRVEDCNLIFYTIDSKVPERARLDIFERVNGGVPLTRQQMRNCLFNGKATQFLKKESRTEAFLKATGDSLSKQNMRDREFVNRFCAFQLLGVDTYEGDMDEFLARCLKRMNAMTDSELSKLSSQFHCGLENNYSLFGENAFRKYYPKQTRRSVLNASLWDVLCTGLSRFSKPDVASHASNLLEAFGNLLKNDDFSDAITRGTNNSTRVKTRFRMTREVLEEVLGAIPN